MADFQLANAKDNNNRIAGAATEELEQAEFVRVNEDEELVPADVSEGVEGQAAGACGTPVIDPDDAKYGTTDFMQNQLREQNIVLAGEGGRAGGFRNNMMLEDQDGNCELTPGMPVYLAQGSENGYDIDAYPVTQYPDEDLEPGDVRQIVGYAEDCNSFVLDVQFTDEVVEE